LCDVISDAQPCPSTTPALSLHHGPIFILFISRFTSFTPKGLAAPPREQKGDPPPHRCGARTMTPLGGAIHLSILTAFTRPTTSGEPPSAGPRAGPRCWRTGVLPGLLSRGGHEMCSRLHIFKGNDEKTPIDQRIAGSEITFLRSLT